MFGSPFLKFTYTDVLPSFIIAIFIHRANVASGKEKGGAFAAFYKGERIVDLWGGWADEDAERKWKEDTITLLFSSTKGVAAIMAAWMVDRSVFLNTVLLDRQIETLFNTYSDIYLFQRKWYTMYLIRKVFLQMILCS